MATSQLCFVFVMVAFAAASPASKYDAWKDTALEKSVEEMRALCANKDLIACFKYQFITLLDSFFKKDVLQLKENVEVSRNSFEVNEIAGRSNPDLEEDVKELIQTHDVTFKLPFSESSVTVGSSNLDKDEIDLKLRFSDSGNEVQARKSKLKKIIVPIFIFILLKAITLIPLALGVLGLKAWNALQLSFFSFVVSIALAVFQLCKRSPPTAPIHKLPHTDRGTRISRGRSTPSKNPSTTKTRKNWPTPHTLNLFE